ncbi:hypothetical protein VHEMI02499 [[Torrubiella] hemipterigena]|uniref:HET-s/LopB domain-containing protein n=1 Tax=[Torrubiella] hemipterigena TaxID=1531966 RepID=A0A0A1T828_9HYPO|nr:hypothetical protein VHEMI02499 [[Torrubiella] hemipterigena]
MESLLPRGGFQLPFQRRLSRLYNDTKKSGEFVKEPIQNEQDPEAKALHRKLRIQKDRLVSWGMEWSDPNQAAEIDESLSKAGLSEVVGSIMSTIKDILAEAEPLWLSSKRVVEGTRSSPDKKPPLIQWDKGRFEDLVNDLTASIDTLYDLSRTRSSGFSARRPSKHTYKAGSTSDDHTTFESTRMQTPQQIDPTTLSFLKAVNQTTPGNAQPRQVVFMSKTAYAELAHGRTREPWGPLLLEYAAFDPIYSTTGIMPSMARFEKLSSGLQQEPQRAPGAWTGLPRLMGYFEDMENSRLGLLYRFPTSFNAVSIERSSQNAVYQMHTLRSLLSQPDAEPELEAKFRMAYNLANTVFDMHARGVTHGSLLDGNISFCDTQTAVSSSSSTVVDVRRPLVSSFELFEAEDGPTNPTNLWRHRLDPRRSQTSPLSKSTDERVLELYALSVLLLSIGLWQSPELLAQDGDSHIIPHSALTSLSRKCGSLYMKAVQACWEAVDDEASGRMTGEGLLSDVQIRVSRFLETCCILDGVSGFEQRVHPEHEVQDKPATSSVAGTASDKPSHATDTRSLPPPAAFVDARAQLEDSPEGVASAARVEKLKLYPNVPLSPEAVEKWNTILMPQINQALRGFYRKNPESVEISLESVGPDAQSTRPTVLVVCTSVGKVRAILKKRLGDLFDGSTGFGLKVCRGHMLRSRKNSRPIYRSMARASVASGSVSGKAAANHDEDIEAVNPEYQECPLSGASIGAWIGDRHLPPVSFGGLVVVDDQTYGMTVHHMLDDPDKEFNTDDTLRSASHPGFDFYDDDGEDVYDEDYGFDLSDSDSESYSETDITSEYGDDDDYDDDDEEYQEPGDIPGIEPGCGDGYIVTQPALDDVEEGFYPCADTEDEDHLDTFSLGQVYASSGIRRKEDKGLIHEVDWALFSFTDGRVPQDNSVQRADAAKDSQGKCIKPTKVAPSTSLPGMRVQCVARTSGVQTGQIMPALCSVKIYGRTSPSQTYQIASARPEQEQSSGTPTKAIPMGIPGDSGAWVVDRDQDQLCGHILAWSQRKRVAYICPMDVLLADIAQTLDASDIRLPGGESLPIANKEHMSKSKTQQSGGSDAVSDEEDEDGDSDEAPELVESTASLGSSTSRSVPTEELHGLSSRLAEISLPMGSTFGVRV